MAHEDAHGHEHGHAHDEHDHEHEPVRYVGAEVSEETLTALRALHPALADALLYSRRYEDLDETGKAALLEAQRAVETHPAWTPGYHAAGDVCVACETPVSPLFKDRFAQGELAYAAFVDDLPVHAREECLRGLDAKAPRRAPQVVDRLRRQFTLERGRPSARVTQFFRHDTLAHPPFELEDWANSVAEANQGKLDRATARDIERLLAWVHRRLYH